MIDVELIGRLTEIPKAMKSTNGKDMSRINVACDSKQVKNKTIFIACVCFGRTAENVVKYLVKGQQIYAKGELDINKSEVNGKTYYNTTVFVNFIQFLQKPKNINNDFTNNYIEEDFAFLTNECS